MAARKSEAVLEESGSVYSVGLNDRGQLGMGDLLPRHKFTVLPTTRGKNVDQLYCVRSTPCVFHALLDIPLTPQQHFYAVCAGERLCVCFDYFT